MAVGGFMLCIPFLHFFSRTKCFYFGPDGGHRGAGDQKMAPEEMKALPWWSLMNPADATALFPLSL